MVRFSFSQPCWEPILPDCVHQMKWLLFKTTNNANQAQKKDDHEMLLFSFWVLWEWHTLLSPQHCRKINPELKIKEIKQTVICGGMETGTLGTNLFGRMLQSLWFAVIALLISGHGDFLNFIVTRLVASLITPNYEISRQLGNQNILVGKACCLRKPFFLLRAESIFPFTPKSAECPFQNIRVRLPQIAGAGT